MRIITIIIILIFTQSVHANKLLETEYIADKLSEIFTTVSYDNLILEQQNDTLYYGQIYPEEKFPIFIVNKEIVIPIFIDESDTTHISAKYRYQFKSKKMMGYFGVQYIVPLTKIERLFDGNSMILSKLKIMDVYDCGLETYYGYVGEVSYDTLLNNVIISCYTKNEYSNYNNFITGDVRIDSSDNIVLIRLIVNTPMIVLPAFGRANGEIRFKPPSDLFQIIFGEDKFNVVLFENDISIAPDSLTTNILKVK